MKATPPLRPALLFLACALLAFSGAGCGSEPETPPVQILTYTFDGPTRELIDLLADRTKNPAYRNFDQSFRGVLVPESLLPYEPFVLGLSTESRIPGVLLLDAPWVQRYGTAGWLYELERTQVFSRQELVPSVAAAFSAAGAPGVGPQPRELMAVPTYIKGNILFYRRDLLDRYHLAPPRQWSELADICLKVMAREKSLKYGLLFHPVNALNDFYPIFWGYGGRIHDDNGHFVLNRPENQKAWVAALSRLLAFQGTILPRPAALKQFEATGSLRQAFYRGEALFMINWNTRMKDLSDLIAQGKGRSGALSGLAQVGVAPIPCQSGRKQRFANIGSFGWGVNRFSVTSPQVMDRARRFIALVSDEQFQLLAAERLGQVPSLRRALTKVTNPEVLQVYRDAFDRPDMVLRARPHSRRINNVLEKYLEEALYGRRTPQGALEAALAELKDLASPD